MPEQTLYLTREPSGQHVLRTAAEIVALGRPYFRSEAGLWLTGDPSAADSGAVAYGGATGRKPLWRGAISVPPPPPPTINWQSAPVLPSGSTDYMVPPGSYYSDDPTKPLFAPTSTRKYVFTDSRLKGTGNMSVGAITDGFGHRLRFDNCELSTVPATQYGQSAAKLLRGKEIRHLEMNGCSLPFVGGGIICSGDGNDIFKGDPASGDGVFLRRVRVRGVDGRRSNGQGGYIKSTAAGSHITNNVGGMRDAGVIAGWDISNFVQFLNMSQTPMTIEDVEILLGLGMAHEDIISCYQASGGHPSIPSYIRRCLIETVSRQDHNWVAGLTTTYRHDGMVSGGWDGPQPTNLNNVKSSDTGIILGDSKNLQYYARNTSHISVEDNVLFGTRPCLNLHNGHHVSILRNSVHLPDRHRSGVMYSGTQYGTYETRDGTVTAEYPLGQSAADMPGEKLWGHHRFLDNGLYAGTTTSTDAVREIMQRNGGEANGLRRYPAVTDGGVQLIADWRAMQAAAGRTIGSTLT